MPLCHESAGEASRDAGMNLFIIDASGPFFLKKKAKNRNWSKIPFSDLEGKSGAPRKKLVSRIIRDFRIFAAAAAESGFNAISIDDLAHLYSHHSYEKKLKKSLLGYRELYEKIFDIAGKNSLRVYVNSDVMFFNDTLMREIRNLDDITDFLLKGIEKVFSEFSLVKGIIFRIGECDGIDRRKEEFQSRLSIRRAADAARLISKLLPAFERQGRSMIVRTWTVGAYSVGDLIWNPLTFNRVFGGIESPSLVISMKPGESDFFRYLSLNRHFFRSAHRKIIEIQSRREYEGFGAYPAFNGSEWSRYLHGIKKAENMAGCMIWCQTGGWGPFRRRTFLDEDGVWNEINTFAALKIFRDGLHPDKALAAYARRRNLDEDVFIKLMKLSEEVIYELLYIDEFAVKRIFFRRTRIPTLLSVYWNHIIINHSMRKLLRCLVDNGDLKIEQGYDALKKIKRMRNLAKELGLPAKDISFQYRTFKIIAAARKYYFGPYNRRIREELESLEAKYNKRYGKEKYSVHIDFSPFPLRGMHMRVLLSLLLRDRRKYRIFDQLFLVGLLSLTYPLLRKIYPFSPKRLFPKFSRKKAMGIHSIFK